MELARVPILQVRIGPIQLKPCARQRESRETSSSKEPVSMAGAAAMGQGGSGKSGGSGRLDYAPAFGILGQAPIGSFLEND